MQTSMSGSGSNSDDSSVQLELELVRDVSHHFRSRSAGNYGGVKNETEQVVDTRNAGGENGDCPETPVNAHGDESGVLENSRSAGNLSAGGDSAGESSSADSHIYFWHDTTWSLADLALTWHHTTWHDSASAFGQSADAGPGSNWSGNGSDSEEDSLNAWLENKPGYKIRDPELLKVFCWSCWKLLVLWKDVLHEPHPPDDAPGPPADEREKAVDAPQPKDDAPHPTQGNM